MEYMDLLNRTDTEFAPLVKSLGHNGFNTLLEIIRFRINKLHSQLESASLEEVPKLQGSIRELKFLESAVINIRGK